MSRSSRPRPDTARSNPDAAGNINRQGGTTLGLVAFEKISAVDGIKLTAQMRRDVRAASRKGMSEGDGIRFLTDRYGRK